MNKDIISWHDIPPVQGWYVSVKAYKGDIESLGGMWFSDDRIAETKPMPNVKYLGPIHFPLADATGRAAAHMDDTRSEHVLRERLGIARNATHGPWALWTWDNGQMEIRSHADPDEERVGMVWNKRDGTFLNRNSPLEVMADIEEILTLRAEKQRLEQMVAQLADFLCCYPDARCPVEIDRIDFTCPHGRTWDEDGCIPFEDECWRAAAAKETGRPCVTCFREEVKAEEESA